MGMGQPSPELSILPHTCTLTNAYSHTHKPLTHAQNIRPCNAAPTCAHACRCCAYADNGHSMCDMPVNTRMLVHTRNPHTDKLSHAQTHTHTQMESYDAPMALLLAYSVCSMGSAHSKGPGSDVMPFRDTFNTCRFAALNVHAHSHIQSVQRTTPFARTLCVLMGSMCVTTTVWVTDNAKKDIVQWVSPNLSIS